MLLIAKVKECPNYCDECDKFVSFWNAGKIALYSKTLTNDERKEVAAIIASCPKGLIKERP